MTLKSRRAVRRVARNPRSRYAHVIKRIKGAPPATIPPQPPVHPRKPGALRYGEPWLTFRHSLRAPFIRHSFASTRITSAAARVGVRACARGPAKSRISRPNERASEWVNERTSDRQRPIDYCERLSLPETSVCVGHCPVYANPSSVSCRLVFNSYCARIHVGNCALRVHLWWLRYAGEWFRFAFRAPLHKSYVSTGARVIFSRAHTRILWHNSPGTIFNRRELNKGTPKWTTRTLETSITHTWLLKRYVRWALTWSRYPFRVFPVHVDLV